MNNFIIAHIGHTSKSSEHIIWWNPDSKGYTVCINKAGLYNEVEARSICSTGLCIAVPKSVASSLVRTTPYFRRSNGSLIKLYDGGPHAVVPNDLQAWKVLLLGRLGGCSHPDKPTPIGAKARAIYIDGITAEGAQHVANHD